MRRLKWWQWTLIVMLGFGVVGLFMDPPPPTKKVAPSPTFADPDEKFAAIGPDIFAMTFSRAANPDALPDLARDQCGAKKICQVIGWSDAAYAARGFPMTDREASHEAFSYSVNRHTGYEQILWDCSVWKRTDKSQCLASGL